MNLKILGILLGVINILVAVWYFDWNSWNQIVISIALFLVGLIILSTDIKSKFLQKARKFLVYIAGIFAVFLIFKVLFVG